jgi:diadenosine tetraphosphate (Ap4A) HIT family hydrolase
MKDGQSPIEEILGGLLVLAGGTRRGVKLTRPWQVGSVEQPTECPFCHLPKDRILRTYGEGPKWLLIDNAHTPHPWHRLIIPRDCWADGELFRLGGAANLSKSLEIAASESENLTEDVFMGVHVGAYAGQNVRHLHYHLVTFGHGVKPMLTEAEILDYGYRYPARIITETPEFLVFAAGPRAGQCLFCPKTRWNLLTEPSAEKAAEMICNLIDTFNLRFQSAQGRPPHFIVGLKLSVGNLIYGYYLPVLNHWGFTEYFALMEGTPLLMPWTYEDTVDHLRDDLSKDTP